MAVTAEKIEQRSIVITITASVSFGLIGIVISLASRSGAVFLDGLFSLIFAVVGVLTLYVCKLVQRPRDEQYPFGYATFEPMLNLFKGILIATALLYAVWTAVRALMTGGQEVAAVGGIIYAAIAVSGGVALVVTLRKLGQRSGSPIVQLDAENAVIDTMISGAVGVAFVATLIIQNSRLSAWAPYADPVIMLAIAAIAAPQPIKTIRSNWRQLMGRAPDRAVQDRIAALVESVLGHVPHSETHLRTTEVGRYLYIHLVRAGGREGADRRPPARPDPAGDLRKRCQANSATWRWTSASPWTSAGRSPACRRRIRRRCIRPVRNRPSERLPARSNRSQSKRTYALAHSRMPRALAILRTYPTSIS